ncbi:MAG: 1-acyl-sn-glycerol-3-phosphate acyltransferase [Planctomycetes bacterium]|nr:1-acyl-sn-glycerol-3-phosphate acyltransferase [Planctomycetota bacterium]
MRDRVAIDGPMPAFWPPRPSRFWSWLLRPLHRAQLRGRYAVSAVEVEGLDRLRALPPEDAALLCPNHSFAGDGAVMLETGRRAPRTFHIMAAWQLFTGHAGLDGWLMQRQGCFSVDREGADRRAMRTAVELLSTGRFLVVFPEGENYHLNDRLTPLREGVAYMAAAAQKELNERGKGRVWLVPVAIRYRFAGDVTEDLSAALERLVARPPFVTMPGGTLPMRIVEFGEFLLAKREARILGRVFHEHRLPERIARLMSHLLARHENQLLGKVDPDEAIPVRVKRLRAKLLELPQEERTDAVKQALSDLHLVIQLFSYPGDYVSSAPTPERMAETLEKFDEDLTGREARPVGKRRARVRLGEPMDVKAALGDGRPRQAAAALTERLEAAIQSLMSR